MTTHVYFYNKDGNDISDDIKVVNKKSNPFGWSQGEFEYKGTLIGIHSCGSISMYEELGFTFKEVEEEDKR